MLYFLLESGYGGSGTRSRNGFVGECLTLYQMLVRFRVCRQHTIGLAAILCFTQVKYNWC